LIRIATAAALAVLLLAASSVGASAQQPPSVPVPSLPEDLTPPPEVPTRFDLNREDIRAFADLMVQKHGFDRTAIMALLASAERQPRILDAIARPAEKMSPWWQYRARFLTPQRIREGHEFWQQHRATLVKVQADTGVPPEYIVAILGVETFYGRITGNWRVIDALMTLGFDYPPRASYFRGELENFLVLARDEKLPAETARGSYAGALGAPQFMPSSWQRFAVDGSGDGLTNLFSDWDDVIASIGNYFRANGWQRGGGVLLEASASPELAATLDPRNLELNETLGSLRRKGVTFSSTDAASERAILLPAELENGLAVRIGLHNFAVITRYNRSIRYAMAAHDLAQEIAALGFPPDT
jgi:membrane-bound lytic murein transglycosylase B